MCGIACGVLCTCVFVLYMVCIVLFSCLLPYSLWCIVEVFFASLCRICLIEGKAIEDMEGKSDFIKQVLSELETLWLPV